jgi:predicted nucleic acid-binding protein
MSNQPWEHLTSVLVDTGVFIHWFRGDRYAQHFFRDPDRTIYYTKVTRKELLHEPIRTSEAVRIKAFLNRFRLINPDEQIAGRFSELLQKYPYLQMHTPDALIAATAWEKKLPLLTLNTRHFTPITEIVVVQFIPTSVDDVSD